MGYFRKPLRRDRARRAKRAALHGTRLAPPPGWTALTSPLRPDGATYLRFEVHHPRAGWTGVFWGSDLLDDPDVAGVELSPEQFAHLRAVLRWFGAHLPVPATLPERAVCWFKPTATDCLDKLRELLDLYREAGLPVAMKTSRRPGRVAYEDPYQLAAVPHRDTRARRTPR